MKKRILAIGAHPDDVELGAGGAIYRHYREGDIVHALIMSSGERGVTDDKLHEDGKALEEGAKAETMGKMREIETRKALVILGVADENIKILGYPDTDIRCSKELIKEIENEILTAKPDIVYTHYFKEQHLDHINTCLATLHVTRKTKVIILYESPSSSPAFSPVYFIDISEFIEKKIEALREHKSQADKEYMEKEVIMAKARFRAFQAGSGKYAEAFVIYRMVA